MSRPPEILDKIADLVLSYRPPDKKKKLATKAKKIEHEKKKKYLKKILPSSSTFCDEKDASTSKLRLDRK